MQGNGKDPYHFGREGVIELGRRYCSEMLKLIDKTLDPDAPPVNLVDPSQSTVEDEPPEDYGPYTDPIEIPGKVQAENYNKGGAGKAYYDLNKGNEGGVLRKDDVDIYQPNMGVAVGYCQKGEWLKYTVNIAADGEYEISANMAGENGTGGFVLYLDDERIGDEMVNDGQGFTTYSVVSGGKATLKAGEHELKLEISNDWVDIDYVEFKALGSPSSGDSSTMAMDVRFNRAEVEGSYELFDLQGNRVMRFNAHGMDDAVRMVKDGISGVRQGVYLVRRPGKAGLTRKVVVGSF